LGKFSRYANLVLSCITTEISSIRIIFIFPCVNGLSKGVRVFMKRISTLIVLVLILPLLPLTVRNHQQALDGIDLTSHQKTMQSRYTTHSPIRINSNSEFNTTNGVSGGDGSSGNPYMIEGWDINGSGAECGYLWGHRLLILPSAIAQCTI